MVSTNAIFSYLWLVKQHTSAHQMISHTRHILKDKMSLKVRLGNNNRLQYQRWKYKTNTQFSWLVGVDRSMDLSPPLLYGCHPVLKLKSFSTTYFYNLAVPSLAYRSLLLLILHPLHYHLLFSTYVPVSVMLSMVFFKKVQ